MPFLFAKKDFLVIIIIVRGGLHVKKIQVLNNNMINQIAAGEVVERPLSVVKELMENSVDAGATNITVEIKDGGMSLIRIADNGKGIPKDEVPIAFLRHATSKIENMDDLMNVLTLGFRGEALSSIASVAQVELITKTVSENIGTRFEIHGDEIITHQNVGAPEGTTIVVRNIFFNVPARRKFLKKPSQEAALISELVNRIALGNPQVSVKYINNENVILQSGGNDDLKSTIFQVYGMDVAKKIIPINLSEDDIKIRGFIGRPEIARGNRKYGNIFINGRFIKSDLITSAVEDAYGSKIFNGKFPVYILNMEVEPTKVDVNVHPTKLEIRFSEEDKIYEIVKQSVRNALESENLIPSEDLGKHKSVTYTDITNTEPIIGEKQNIFDLLKSNESNESREDRRIEQLDSEESVVDVVIEDDAPVFVLNESNSSMASMQREKDFIPDSVKKDIENFDFTFTEKDITPNLEIKKDDSEIEIKNKTETEHNEDKTFNEIKETPIKEIKEATKKEEFKKLFANYKIIGQIFNTYWIIEHQNVMYIIDQHAAHERILFEEIREKLQSKKVNSQPLLRPMILNLSLEEIEILKDNEEIINEFGFEIEEFGQNKYALRSVPYIFNEPENANFFYDIIDALQINRTIENIYDAKSDDIALISCKAAVKGNDNLSYQEAEALIRRLLNIKNPFTCPHGRPTIIEMSRYELEKKFKRV